MKSLSLVLLVSIFSINSYAVVLDCHRKADAKKTSVGAFYYDGAKPVLQLDTQLFDEYGSYSLPAGIYKLDSNDDFKAAVSCRDGWEPQVDTTETKLDSGLELKIAISCFDDPHVSTDTYEVVCK